LQRRHDDTLRLLDEMHADYEDRVERAMAGIRACASRTPASRRETPDEARRRLGLPGR
jgi:hypothetical protein